MAQQVKECKWSERGNRLHAALAETHALDFSINKTLFDAVLHEERFREWHSSTDTWQLRFSGSPGCGKTTLSSIVVGKLREGPYCVASIYVQQDVACYEAAFAEDFLWAIYTQFARHVPNASSTHGEVEDHLVQYEKYVAACIVQQRGPYRINLIRSALHAIIPALPRQAFLIVDDIDRCSAAATIHVEEEISQLQHQGVKIMTTSRVPRIEESWTPARCDGQECSAKDPRPWTHVYWVCEDCMQHSDKEQLGMTVFCNTCWPEKAICIRCTPRLRADNSCLLVFSNNTSRFKQPFEHVDFNISNIPDFETSNFVRRAIQQEHGDVGLGGPPTPREGPDETLLSPPLFTSIMGVQLLRTHKDMAERVVRDIVECAQGNIALAHKRLELFHRARFVEAFLARHDRLPASVVDLFDAGLRGVEAQTPRERTLGLQAIAVAGRSISGVPWEEFQRLLRQGDERDRGEDGTTIIHDGNIASPCLDDVLHAAKGFVVRQNDRGRRPKLVAFHPDFYLYCGQGYRESIVRMNDSLNPLP
ncbi:hypothetical protein PG994_005008 [Apiospora phragmitis]|uniref:Nephrocystin 3-like N-terminal domain-containing protein n=1 Tax=Apiospora phragmitis TaxID=2905665 RepID=A0ABR1VS75_9PEZI